MKISEGANRLLWGLPTLGWIWSSVNWNPQHLAMQHRVYTFLNSCTVKHYTQVSLILWAYSALVLLPDYYYVYWSQNLLGVQMWQQLFSYALNSCTCYHVIYRTNSIPFQRLKYERMYAFFFLQAITYSIRNTADWSWGKETNKLFTFFLAARSVLKKTKLSLPQKRMFYQAGSLVVHHILYILP